MSDFTIKDSGTRTSFGGGMVRDGDAADKIDYTSVMFGPMLERWAVHCTKGRVKYPDSSPGIPNWTLASGIEEFLHARGSLLRHLFAYLRGETDEDHAAAIMFNVNLMEYVRERVGYVPTVFLAAPVSEGNAGDIDMSNWLPCGPECCPDDPCYVPERPRPYLVDREDDEQPEDEWGTPVDLSGEPFEPFGGGAPDE